VLLSLLSLLSLSLFCGVVVVVWLVFVGGLLFGWLFGWFVVVRCCSLVRCCLVGWLLLFGWL
jgi:hypothetical protein